MPVVAGRTVEVCIVQYWSQHNASKLLVDVNFHGLQVDNNNVKLVAGEAFTLVHAQAVLEDMKLNPSVTLNTWARELTPGICLPFSTLLTC